MIRLRYFASLRETLGIGDEQIELPDNVNTVSGLTRWLCERDASWHSALSDARLHIAVNQEIITADITIKDGDEVAWFPPVTGG